MTTIKYIDLECEEEMNQIEWGLSALRTIWDSVAHSRCVNQNTQQEALHFVIGHMEGAREALAQKLKEHGTGKIAKPRPNTRQHERGDSSNSTSGD